MPFLKALKPSGMALMRAAHSRHEPLSSMLKPRPCEYIGMASRNGPPISTQTGLFRILPARSHNAMSMPEITPICAM